VNSTGRDRRRSAVIGAGRGGIAAALARIALQEAAITGLGWNIRTRSVASAIHGSCRSHDNADAEEQYSDISL